MRNPWLRWLPILAVATLWTIAWGASWQLDLFNRLGRVGDPSIVLFEAEVSELRGMRIAAAATVVTVGIGYFLIVQSSILRAHAPPTSIVLAVSGWALTLIGFSLLVLFPSTKDLVVDKESEVVSLESRWLYASESKALPYDDIRRVGLRVIRKAVGNDRSACQVATGLSIVRHNGTWLDIPHGFDHEVVARLVADTVDVPLDAHEVREC